MENNENVKKKDFIENKKPKKVKKEISFQFFIKDKKSKLDELKNFFENVKNNQKNDLKSNDVIFYNTQVELNDIIKRMNFIFASNKKIIIPFKYKKLIYDFSIRELIRSNEKNHYINTLNIVDLKNTFPPNISNFETVIKLASFFSNRKIDEDIIEEKFIQDKMVFIEILKLYLNIIADTVNWITVDLIIKLAESIQNLKSKKLNEKKLVSNSLFFINKLDYIFTFREFFQPLKNQLQQLNSMNISNKKTIADLKDVVIKKNHELIEINNRKSELEKEMAEAKLNFQSLNIKSNSKQASSWQEKNEIIGKVQINLSSFLNYELNIANEAVLDGEGGALKASKMIDKLILKIKEQKEWLSSLD